MPPTIEEQIEAARENYATALKELEDFNEQPPDPNPRANARKLDQLNSTLALRRETLLRFDPLAFTEVVQAGDEVDPALAGGPDVDEDEDDSPLTELLINEQTVKAGVFPVSTDPTEIQGLTVIEFDLDDEDGTEHTWQILKNTRNEAEQELVLMSRNTTHAQHVFEIEARDLEGRPYVRPAAADDVQGGAGGDAGGSREGAGAPAGDESRETSSGDATDVGRRPEGRPLEAEGGRGDEGAAAEDGEGSAPPLSDEEQAKLDAMAAAAAQEGNGAQEAREIHDSGPGGGR